MIGEVVLIYTLIALAWATLIFAFINVILIDGGYI